MKRPGISRRQSLTWLLGSCGLPALVWGGEHDAGRDVPWLAEVQRPPERLPPDAPRLGPLLVDEAGHAITTLEGWQRRRAEIRRWWLEFLGPLNRPDAEGPRQGARASRRQLPASNLLTGQWPPKLEVIGEDRPEDALRQLVRYEVEPGLLVEAYLLKPARVQGRRPGVIVLHSTVNYTIRQPAGLEGPAEKAFALKMARQGYVAFCPRCFLWSSDLSVPYMKHVEEFRARHPGSKGMAKMLFDAQVGLDILASLPEVDPQRLGAVGHSLGAKEVLYLAALDERVQAAVSSEGGIGTRFSNWDAPWYLGEEIRGEAFRHEHHELLALVAPRPFLLLGGDSADGDRSWPFIEAVLPVYRLYGSTPRVGLFNHRKGHNVPPEAEQRIDQWFETYL